MSDSESQAPVSPLHLAVSSRCLYLVVCLSHVQDFAVSAMSVPIRHNRSVYWCVSSIDLGLPWPLWSFRGSLVVLAGSGCLQPGGPNPPQPGLLQGSPGVCLHAAAPRLLTHDP